MGQEVENGCKLFVGGLSHETTDLSLLKYFESFGKVASAVVLRDPETLSSRGFGFVTFSSRKEAQNCLNFGNHTIDHKHVETKSALPRPSYVTSSSSNNSPPVPSSSSNYDQANSSYQVEQTERDPREGDYISTKVFVGGLLYATVAETLREYFESYGPVSMTEIIYNKETKISRGFGFVEFVEPESVEEVIEYQSSGQRHRVDGKKVEVKRCLKKNDPQFSNNGSSSQGNAQDDLQLDSPMASQSSVKESSKNVPVKVSLSLTKRNSVNSGKKITSFAQAAAMGTRHEKGELQTSTPTPIHKLPSPMYNTREAVKSPDFEFFSKPSTNANIEFDLTLKDEDHDKEYEDLLAMNNSGAAAADSDDLSLLTKFDDVMGLTSASDTTRAFKPKSKNPALSQMKDIPDLAYDKLIGEPSTPKKSHNIWNNFSALKSPARSSSQNKPSPAAFFNIHDEAEEEETTELNVSAKPFEFEVPLQKSQSMPLQSQLQPHSQPFQPQSLAHEQQQRPQVQPQYVIPPNQMPPPQPFPGGAYMMGNQGGVFYAAPQFMYQDFGPQVRAPGYMEYPPAAYPEGNGNIYPQHQTQQTSAQQNVDGNFQQQYWQ